MAHRENRPWLFWAVIGLGFLATIGCWIRSLQFQEIWVQELFADWQIAFGSGEGSLFLLIANWPDDDWFALEAGYHKYPIDKTPGNGWDPSNTWGDFQGEFDPSDAVLCAMPWWFVLLIGFVATGWFAWARRRKRGSPSPAA